MDGPRIGAIPSAPMHCGNAHHERELIAPEENTHQTWPKALITHRHPIQQAVAEAVTAGQTAFMPDVLAAFSASYDDSIRQGLAENPRRVPAGDKKRGRVKQPKTRHL